MIFISISSPLFSQTDSTSNPTINQVISIVNQVDEKNNFIDQLSPDSNVALPFGIIKKIGAARYIIAVDSMKFQPQAAYLSACAAIDFPGSTKKLVFRASHIKFNPSGVIGGDQAKLYLASDHLIKINNTVSLKLQNNGKNYVMWDCNGFKSIHLSGDFIFNKSYLLPDSTKTKAKQVTATFEIATTDIHNFITQVSITPFTLKGLKDWTFEVANATVDMSELVNANAMVFPREYPVQNLATPQMWTGFLLQSLKIKLPREISKTGDRTEINVNNLLIDHTGLSGLFKVNNLFNLKEGSMSGWAFSIDEIGFGFTANMISSGHFKGKVNMPLMDSTETLQYSASIGQSLRTNETGYNFLINPVSNISFHVFKAQGSLNNNSFISVTKQNGMFKPSANLCGSIGFNDPKFNSNGGKLSFQNLTLVTNAPYITNGVFTLHNTSGGQTKVNNYPVNLNEVTFGIDQGSPVLGFSVSLNLSDQSAGSIAVGTSILLKGKTESIQQTFSGENPVSITKPKFKFDRVVVNGIGLNYGAGPITLKGTLVYRDDNPIYGTGFFGNLEMFIPRISPTPIYVSSCFGRMPDYSYFYLDTKVNTDVSLGELPIKLSRIIGGLYYHMTPNKTTEEDFITLNKNFTGAAGNALVYTPNENTSIGLKAGVSYECTLNQIPYNGDVIFEINFTSSGGLGIVNLSGDIYSVALITNRATAPVKGKIAMVYDTPNKTFDAVSQVEINSHQVVTGAGFLKLHVDPQTWYCCIGKPSAPCRVNFANLADMPFYCMVGNSLESPLPPPDQVSQLPGLSSFYGNRNTSQLQSAGGFCAGSKITSNLNKTVKANLFQITGDFNFDLGFDMMLTNYGPNSHCSDNTDKIGVNGWLAEGSMYVAMNGKIDISGHLKLTANCPNSTTSHKACGPKHCCCVTLTTPCIVNKSFSHNVLSGDATAVVAAKGPKPLYFEGSVKFHYNILEKIEGEHYYDFTYGTNCSPLPN